MTPLSLTSSYSPATRVGPIERRGPTPPGDDATVARGGNDPTTTRGADQVEISFSAQSRASHAEQPARADLVSRVRTEIESGTYETPEKLDIAVGRALCELA